jgi:hypothetical protein
MTEDKNCKPWVKPFYYVWEAAAFWCGISNQEISIDEDGLPDLDSQYPCLRSRAEWIRDAIYHKELVCGYQGKLVRHGIIPTLPQTIRRKDLRNWFLSYRTERPPFLFDETELSDLAVINPEIFQALQTDFEAEKALHEKTKEQLQDMVDKLAAVEQERATLKQYSGESAKRDNLDSPANERSKTSFLHLIGALLDTIMDKDKVLFKTEEALRTHIAERYKGFPGCTFRTTAERFAEAKKLLSQ